MAVYIHVAEEGCTYQEVPFALLSGENVEYMGRLEEAELLYLTNYRLLATHRDGIYSVSSSFLLVLVLAGVSSSEECIAGSNMTII